MNKLAIYIFSILLIILFPIQSYSEHKIEIILCDEMMKKKQNSLVRLLYVNENDTIVIPYLGNNKYLSPFQPGEIAKEDQKHIIIIIENCRYLYPIAIYNIDFTYPYMEICISKRNKWWSKYFYGTNFNYNGRYGFGLIQRYRKK